MDRGAWQATVDGEGELVITLKSWEMTRASRRVEEGLSRSATVVVSAFPPGLLTLR